MNYADLVRFHRERQADVTICLHPVDRTEARRMGLAEVALSGFITRYVEKPQDLPIIDSFRILPYLSAAPENDLHDKVLASTCRPAISRLQRSGTPWLLKVSS